MSTRAGGTFLTEIAQVKRNQKLTLKCHLWKKKRPLISNLFHITCSVRRSIGKNYSNITPQKENGNSPEIKHKVKE